MKRAKFTCYIVSLYFEDHIVYQMQNIMDRLVS